MQRKGTSGSSLKYLQSLSVKVTENEETYQFMLGVWNFIPNVLKSTESHDEHLKIVFKK